MVWLIIMRIRYNRLRDVGERRAVFRLGKKMFSGVVISTSAKFTHLFYPSL